MVAVDTVDGKLAVNIFVFAVIHHFLYLIILVVAYRYLIAGRCLEAVLGKACGKVAHVGVVDTDIAYHLRGTVKSDNGLELQAFGEVGSHVDFVDIRRRVARLVDKFHIESVARFAYVLTAYRNLVQHVAPRARLYGKLRLLVGVIKYGNSVFLGFELFSVGTHYRNFGAIVHFHRNRLGAVLRFRNYRESVGRIGTSIRAGIDIVVIAKITFFDIIAI